MITFSSWLNSVSGTMMVCSLTRPPRSVCTHAQAITYVEYACYWPGWLSMCSQGLQDEPCRKRCEVTCSRMSFSACMRSSSEASLKYLRQQHYNSSKVLPFLPHTKGDIKLAFALPLTAEIVRVVPLIVCSSKGQTVPCESWQAHIVSVEECKPAALSKITMMSQGQS